MDNKSYMFTRIEKIDIDMDEYIDDIIGCVESRLCDDYDISYKDLEKSFTFSIIMKDITKKLVEKYVDKT